MMDLKEWFKGFEKGVASLSGEQRELFFSECGKNCVGNGVLSLYEEVYRTAHADLDTFFLKVNELPGVKGEILDKGCCYQLCFLGVSGKFRCIG